MNSTCSYLKMQNEVMTLDMINAMDQPHMIRPIRQRKERQPWGKEPITKKRSNTRKMVTGPFYRPGGLFQTSEAGSI